MAMKFDTNGLIPAIIQDAETRQVLMLGYMNNESINQTLVSGRVTFFSRSRQELWIKGETSGNFLNLVSLDVDCDEDALLVKVRPEGPVCHTGEDTCWGETNQAGDLQFLSQLEAVILDRYDQPDDDDSYTAKLFKKGTAKIAQKVGEEAVELVIEAMKKDEDEEFIGEAADLMYHYLVLLRDRGLSLSDIVGKLQSRHKK